MTTKHSKRRTSKLFLLVNTVLAWALAFYGVYAGQGAAVVASALGVVGLGYSAYTGIGHLDYRRFLNFISNQSEPFHVAYQELEAGGPDGGLSGPDRDRHGPLPEG